jgi:hypothetical protein
MVVFTVAWLGDGPSFLLAGADTGAWQIERVDPPAPPVVAWKSTTEIIQDVTVSDDGAELEARTVAWNRNFGLLERR